MLDLLRGWVFPSICEGCGRAGRALCAICAPAAADAIRFAVGGVPAFALGAYAGALRAAIVAMKHGARDPLDTFAALLKDVPIQGVLVPLPTSRARAAQRGFDQSVAIVRRLAATRAIAVAELLVKRGRPQAGRGRSERLAAAKQFGLRTAGPVPSAVTLFDDVCTTGTTIRDATRVLRAAGAEVCGVVVIARSPAGLPRRG